jgi:hypothetical protein
MKKLLALLLVVTAAAPVCALEPVGDPSLAVVRIKSHGASGTIIAATDGKSWILSCAHMFFGPAGTIDENLTRKRILIDGPDQPRAPRKLADVRLIAIDADSDLSLLEIANGPFNHIPVARPGFTPGTNLASVGYDEMRWPVTRRRATIVIVMNDWTYTREKPWHGRSGGGLFDLDAKCLIGVVNGYEIAGQERGIYVSHASVLRFLAKQQALLGVPPAPTLRERRTPPDFELRQSPPVRGDGCLT